MSLPPLSFTFTDLQTGYRRIVETINAILNFTFDDSRIRAPAEIAVGVTPVDYAYAPGNILRYGTKGTPDMTTAFNNAIAVAQAGVGFVYLPAAGGPYNFLSPITIGNVNGISIYGDSAAISTPGTHFSNNTVLIFDNAPNGSDAITVSPFVGFKTRDLFISMRRNVVAGVGSGGGRALYLNTGHDFELDNIKVDLAVGPASGSTPSAAGIMLGGGTGPTSTFLGSITNCKVISDGGQTIVTNNTNTSLRFSTCYSIKGSWGIYSNTYSTWESCACDGAPAADHYGYVVQTASGGSPNSGLSFISCGAEVADRGAWHVNGAVNCTWTSPVGSANNQSGGAGYGSLFFFDSTGTTNTNNTIIGPTDANPNAATTASIYANAGNGDLRVINANANYLSKGIGGDTTWMLNHLTVDGDANVEVQSFTATLGTGWTTVGAVTITGTFVKKGKVVTVNIKVAAATSIAAAANARINIPWVPSFNGSLPQVDGNNVSYGAATAATTGQVFVQSTGGAITVPLYFQGSFFIA